MMDQPLYLTKNKKKLLKIIHLRIWQKQVLKYIFLWVFTVMNYYLFKKTYLFLKLKWVDYWEKQKEKLRGLKNIFTESLLCSVCLNQPKSTIFLPCKHFTMCKGCYNYL